MALHVFPQHDTLVHSPTPTCTCRPHRKRTWRRTGHGLTFGRLIVHRDATARRRAPVRRDRLHT